ncbi:MAG: exodeoxyribonuclease VII small subunit [Bacteroidaceae bacterium]|nr:exodeoxyribonuclease VII small subunit [Bacteroidaceae bacterium]
MKYSEAIKRLEEIQEEVSNPSIDIDKLTTLLEESQKLLAFCKAQLTKTNENIEAMLEQNDKS